MPWAWIRLHWLQKEVWLYLSLRENDYLYDYDCDMIISSRFQYSMTYILYIMVQFKEKSMVKTGFALGCGYLVTDKSLAHLTQSRSG